MASPAFSDDPGRLDAEIRARRELLTRTGETYLAVAERLDDEIAALEAARRLASPALDVDFEPLLDAAERDARLS